MRSPPPSAPPATTSTATPARRCTAACSAETPATDAAVAATSGQIVTYDGQPAVTYFFASSGGYTESIQNVWAGATPEPWLRGVPDPYDNAGGDPYHSWSPQMSLTAAAPPSSDAWSGAGWSGSR